MFGSPDEARLGVQIAAGCVRVVEAEHGPRGSCRVRRRQSAPLPPAGEDDEVATAAVLRGLAAAGTARAATLELPLGEVFCQTLSLPDGLDDAALEPLIELEACRLLGAQARELAVDFSVCSGVPQRAGWQQLWFAAARRPRVQRRLRLARMAGLRPLAVEVDLLALHRAVLRQHPADAGVSQALLGVDAHGVSLLMCDGGHVGWVQRRACALPPTPHEQAQALVATLQFALAATHRTLPERLLLHGELGSAAALVAAMQDRLPCACAVFDPWHGQAQCWPPEPEFGVASGLALRRR